jgi:putative ATP-dependent endonuclease of OLD family
MRLVGLRLKNFRAYKDEQYLRIEALTALVGRNDVGKSTIFEALGVFFEHESCKLEGTDRCVHNPPDMDIEITCLFSSLPAEIILDDSVRTTLAAEFLLNKDGLLEIKKRYSGEKPKAEVFAIARHPVDVPLMDLLQKKNTELKRVADHLRVTGDRRSNVELRAAIRSTVISPSFDDLEIPLNKEGAKEIWAALVPHLPLFAIFRSDRPSNDEDGEVQDPMRIAIKQAIREVGPELQVIQQKVEQRAIEVATRTLEKISEISESLSSTLSPRFRTDQKWDSLFKLSLTGDHDIPINKRGSGVRRLVLLGFFQAEVERRRTTGNHASVMYAIEEPETSQHPTNQVAVIEALKALAKEEGVQVLLTTHVPALAGLLPIQGVHHITQDESVRRAIESGDGILKKIADDLGVLPDYQDTRVKVFLCLEGPTDVEFFRRLTPILRAHNPALPDLGSDPRIALIPLGGDTLKDWMNKRYLRELNKPEVHIYDSDVAKYSDACVEVNARGDGSWACQTNKREIENYLHADAIEEVFGSSVIVSDESDVEKNISVALGGRGRFQRRSIKRVLAEDVVPRMTISRLKARAGFEEISGWYRRIGEML